MASASASSTESEDDIIINFDTVLLNDIFTRRRSIFIHESNNVKTVVNFRPIASGEKFLVVTRLDIEKPIMLQSEASKYAGMHFQLQQDEEAQTRYKRIIKIDSEPMVVGIIDGRMRIIIKSNGSSCLQPQTEMNDIDKVTISCDVSYKFTEDFNIVFAAAFNESKMKKLALQSTLNNQHKEYSFNKNGEDRSLCFFKLTKNIFNYTVNAKAEIQGKGKKWSPSQDIAYDDWKSLKNSNIGISGVPSNAGLMGGSELVKSYNPSPEDNSTTIVVLDTPSGGSNKYNGGKNKTQIHHRRRFRKTNKRKNKKRTMRRSKRRNNK
jgi:hypothetical protein